MLAKYVEGEHQNWDKYLPLVMMAYRSSVHESTQFTPNRLMLGRETSTPLDIQFPLQTECRYRSQWAQNLKERMQNAHELVIENVSEAMKRQKKLYDAKLAQFQIKEGDQVLVFFPRVPEGGTAKLSSFWRGPFKVLKQVGPVNFKIDCGRQHTPQVVHLDRIKPCRDQDLFDEYSEDEMQQNHLDLECDDTEEMSVQRDQDARREKAMQRDEVHGSHEEPSTSTAEETHAKRPQRAHKLPKKLQDYDLD